jgi:hypothetical protein
VSERYPRIRLYREVDGARYLSVRESVSITFYMRCSHQEVAPAVMRALDVYCRSVGPRALGWYVDAEGDWQELDDAGWALARQKLLRPQGARLELAGAPDEKTGYVFSYRGVQRDSLVVANNPGAVCMVAFWLPTEFLEAHGPERVRGLALELARELPFNSGQAGLSFQLTEDVVGIGSALREWCFRYPGVDIPHSRMALSIGTRVRGASWLTFLGQPVLDELGGAAGLRSRLSSPDITVQELEGERALISLGQWPEAGDAAQGRTLSPYRELARVLEPWLYQSPTPWNGFSEEDMRCWERRFLD